MNITVPTMYPRKGPMSITFHLSVKRVDPRTSDSELVSVSERDAICLHLPKSNDMGNWHGVLPCCPSLMGEKKFSVNKNVFLTALA